MLILGLQKVTLLDYPGEIACTVFLGGCNFRCPFCHNGSLVLEDRMGESISPDEFFAFLDSRKGRLQGVCVSGGEPTLHSDLPEFLREIKARGFLVKLDTNGTNPEMLSSLIADGLVDYVAMDIKNSPKKYLKTAGLDEECRMQSAECRMQSAECRMQSVSSNKTVDNCFLRDECAETRSDASDTCPREQNDYVSREKVQNAEKQGACDDQCTKTEDATRFQELVRRVKESASLLMRGGVDFEFRTTLMRELHTTDDIKEIGRWLEGEEKYFLQTYREEVDLIVGGFTPFEKDETEGLLALLREHLPNAQIRG